MRRFFAVSAAVAFLLLACGQQQEKSLLPPEEVLRLAAEKSQNLLSAHFTVDAEFSTQQSFIPISGTIRLDGILQDGGKMVQCNASVDTKIVPPGNESEEVRVVGSADIVLAGQREIYFRLQSLETGSTQQFFQKDLITLLKDAWWQLPSEDQQGALPAGTITPPPGLLHAQSQVVRIVEDEGMTTMNGRKAYHYRVTVDREKLVSYLEQLARTQNQPFDRAGVTAALQSLSAEGEMWIDAETYFLQRISWEVDSLGEVGGGMVVSGSFTVALSDYNAAPAIVLPKDARLLTPAVLFGTEAIPTSAETNAEELNRLRELMREFSSASSATSSLLP